MTVAVREPVAAVSDRLDGVCATLHGLDDRGITQALRDIEALSRRTHAVMPNLVAETDSRGIATREGFGTTARLLAGMLHLPAAEARPVRGELRLRERRDGRLGLEGWLNPEHGSIVRSLIEQLVARRPDTAGTPDGRTVPERQADALIELCDRARAADGFPTTGGEPPTSQ